MCEISVIVPCHNSMPYIKEAFKSLLNQSFKDFEVIFVDDGSFDGTFEFIQESALRYSFVSFLQNPIQGAGGSRNLGLQYAKGNYLIFLDSDDVFSPSLLQKLYSTAVKTASDATICEYESFIDGTDTFKLNASFRAFPKIFQPQDMSIDLLMALDSVAWNKLFKKELFIKHDINFQNCRHSNDVYGVYSALLNSETISLVSRPLVRYRTGRNKSTQGKKSKDPSGILIPFRQLVQDFADRLDFAKIIYGSFLMHFRSNFNNMDSVFASGKLWDAFRDDQLLFDWMQRHRLKIRLWEDALFFCVCKMSFSDFSKKMQGKITFFRLILPKRFKKFALLFSAVLYYSINFK